MIAFGRRLGDWNDRFLIPAIAGLALGMITTAMFA